MYALFTDTDTDITPEVAAHYGMKLISMPYEIDGKEVDNFPVGDALAKAKPVYEYFDGWNADISKCRKFEDLPENAQKYVEMIEKAIGCPIKYVSGGACRDEYIER